MGVDNRNVILIEYLKCNSGLAWSITGNILVVDSVGNRVRQVILPDAVVCLMIIKVTLYVDLFPIQIVRVVQVTTLAGSSTGYSDGPAASAQFNYPRGLVTDSGGNAFVVDQYNSRVRRIDWLNGQVTTVAGSGLALELDGIGLAASLNYPNGVIMLNGSLYVSDYYGGTVRLIGMCEVMCVTPK